MRMTRRLSFVATLVVALLAQPLRRRTRALADRQYDLQILLLGNSLSRGIKKPLESMLEAEGHTPFIKAVAPSVANLAFHVQSKRTAKYINDPEHDWDVVFLQERSTGISEANGGYDATRQLYQKIRPTGARIVMFQTWRERTVPTSSAVWDLLKGEPGGRSGTFRSPMSSASVSRPWGGQCAKPVFQIGTPPPYDLWKGGKGRHLSSIGDYLAACVVYSVVTGESSRGVWAPINCPCSQQTSSRSSRTRSSSRNAATWNLNN
jgi:hypothetical protein